MIIAGKKIFKVEITKEPEGKTVAVLTDERANTTEGYHVKATLDVSPGPDALVWRGDLLHYVDEPEKSYIVTKATDKMFIMCPIIYDDLKKPHMDDAHERVYPNDKNINTLAGYKLELEYTERGKYLDGDSTETENEENIDPAHN